MSIILHRRLARSHDSALITPFDLVSENIPTFDDHGEATYLARWFWGLYMQIFYCQTAYSNSVTPLFYSAPMVEDYIHQASREIRASTSSPSIRKMVEDVESMQDYRELPGLMATDLQARGLYDLIPRELVMLVYSAYDSRRKMDFNFSKIEISIPTCEINKLAVYATKFTIDKFQQLDGNDESYRVMSPLDRLAMSIFAYNSDGQVATNRDLHFALKFMAMSARPLRPDVPAGTLFLANRIATGVLSEEYPSVQCQYLMYNESIDSSPNLLMDWFLLPVAETNNTTHEDAISVKIKTILWRIANKRPVGATESSESAEQPYIFVLEAADVAGSADDTGDDKSDDADPASDDDPDPNADADDGTDDDDTTQPDETDGGNDTPPEEEPDVPDDVSVVDTMGKAFLDYMERVKLVKSAVTPATKAVLTRLGYLLSLDDIYRLIKIINR